MSKQLSKITFVPVALVVMVVSLMLPTLVRAQDATPSAQDTIALEREAARQQRETLYQAQIEDYSTKERQFRLDKATWTSLQTLRSLEEAVVATREVMIARDRALITYFELLLQKLEDTPGIELTLKQQSKDGVVAQIEWLRTHLEQAKQSVDRTGVNATADSFIAAAPKLTADAQQALMLIRLGQLQTTFDRTNSLYERILERNASDEGSASVQVERRRAYEQVNLTKNQLYGQLRTARESLDPKTAERGKTAEYAGFISSLVTPYSGISRYLTYLEELARDRW